MNGPYEDITKEHKEEDNNDNNDNDNVVINAPNVLADIQLAKTVCEWIYILAFFSNIFNSISMLSLP